MMFNQQFKATPNFQSNNRKNIFMNNSLHCASCNNKQSGCIDTEGLLNYQSVD